MKKNNKKKNHRLLLYLIGFVVIFIVVGKCSGLFSKEVGLEILTEFPVKRTIVETITASGKIQPQTEVKISPDVSGEIVDLFVVEGQEVKEGDLLLKIRPDTYLSNLDRMMATVNSAKSQHEQAKAQLIEKEANYERMKGLYEKGAISKSEFETAESGYKVAKANADAARYSVKSSEASLSEARENLTKTSIYAPMSGVVSVLNVEKGERVVGTMQMAGTEMLRIADLNKMEARVEVNENDIIKVKLNDTAIIEIDAYLGTKFMGVVSSIANSANSTQVSTDQATSFDVKIRILPESYAELLKEKPQPFRPGMSASVDIQTKTVNNVLSVPIKAVTARPDSLSKENNQIEDNTELIEVVFVYKNGKVKMQKVITGIMDNNYIEIISGINEEDEIVTDPYDAVSKKLKDNSSVKKVKKLSSEPGE
ncbi:MAG: efflux RND transporter periplasmic adaptor subunit [Bacteroidales bacterium]|nr:efflux RND transporter periplasmic adaptor subunit [Bacteroidales bacterium]